AFATFDPRGFSVQSSLTRRGHVLAFGGLKPTAKFKRRIRDEKNQGAVTRFCLGQVGAEAAGLVKTSRTRSLPLSGSDRSTTPSAARTPLLNRGGEFL